MKLQEAKGQISTRAFNLLVRAVCRSFDCDVNTARDKTLYEIAGEVGVPDLIKIRPRAFVSINQIIRLFEKHELPFQITDWAGSRDGWMNFIQALNTRRP